MHGEAQLLFRIMEGFTNRFIIPVYQRNYAWTTDQCKRLFDDLIKLKRNNCETHFLGSIVRAKASGKSSNSYLIIDGQQRLTTISLMLLALCHLLENGMVFSESDQLVRKIYGSMLIDPYAEVRNQRKLILIKDDDEAYNALFNKNAKRDPRSNITQNYNYFYKRIQKAELSPDDLFDAVTKLQIIDISLDENDQPQLIFESLNSTGLDLSEGDKIRNYVLMGIRPASEQERLYFDYWYLIEQKVGGDVSDFIRDYLSIKLKSTPTLKKVYTTFRDYFDQHVKCETEELLQELLNYAGRYEKLIKPEINSGEIADVITRLNRFGASVIKPYVMEVFRIAEDGPNRILDDSDVLKILKTIESFLLRRLVCDIPSNALNSLFVNLHQEILNLDNTADNYLQKFFYVMRNKKRTSVFPDDTSFTEALTVKQIYNMQTKNKKYLLERFENYGTRETKDVWTLLENGTYTIEHIMPQKLSKQWIEMLGTDYEEIHEKWLHRLANLTLSAYNSRYSNSSFEKKRDMENGFKNSGLRMNQTISRCSKWTETELIERNSELMKKALKIWPLPSTSYYERMTADKSISLDEDVDYSYKKIQSYTLHGVEVKVKNWTDMYIKVLQDLHEENEEVLNRFANDHSKKDLANHVFSEPIETKTNELKTGIHIYTNLSTNEKINVLRKFFKAFDTDPEELSFKLKSSDEMKSDALKDKAQELQMFWSAVYPEISKFTNFFEGLSHEYANLERKFYLEGSVMGVAAGRRKIRLYCAFNSQDQAFNDYMFEKLYSDREAIFEESGLHFVWDRMEGYKRTKLYIERRDIGRENKLNWPEIAKFIGVHAKKMQEVLLPRIKKNSESYYKSEKDSE